MLPAFCIAETRRTCVRPRFGWSRTTSVSSRACRRILRSLSSAACGPIDISRQRRVRGHVCVGVPIVGRAAVDQLDEFARRAPPAAARRGTAKPNVWVDPRCRPYISSVASLSLERSKRLWRFLLHTCRPELANLRIAGGQCRIRFATLEMPLIHRLQQPQFHLPAARQLARAGASQESAYRQAQCARPDGMAEENLTTTPGRPRTAAWAPARQRTADFWFNVPSP